MFDLVIDIFWCKVSRTKLYIITLYTIKRRKRNQQKELYHKKKKNKTRAIPKRGYSNLTQNL